MQNLDATDFALSGTAVSGSTSIDSVTNTSGNVWAVSVSGLGNGSFNIALDGDVQDVAGNDLALVSWGYTNTLSPPTVESTSPPDQDSVSGTSLSVDVAFSEAVQGVVASSLNLSNAAAASATVDSVADQGSNVWRFEISGLVPGDLDLSVATSVTDLDGNPLVTNLWSYTIEASNGVFSVNSANVNQPVGVMVNRLVDLSGDNLGMGPRSGDETVISPNGRWMAVKEASNTWHLWDRDNDTLQSLPHGQPVWTEDNKLITIFSDTVTKREPTDLSAIASHQFSFPSGITSGAWTLLTGTNHLEAAWAFISGSRIWYGLVDMSSMTETQNFEFDDSIHGGGFTGHESNWTGEYWVLAEDATGFDFRMGPDGSNWTQISGVAAVGGLKEEGWTHPTYQGRYALFSSSIADTIHIYDFVAETEYASVSLPSGADYNYHHGDIRGAFAVVSTKDDATGAGHILLIDIQTGTYQRLADFTQIGTGNFSNTARPCINRHGTVVAYHTLEFAPTTQRDLVVMDIPGAAPQSIPYSQNFAALPTAAEGWEYRREVANSQINVSSNELQLHTFANNVVNTGSGAILHLDLTGQSNLFLEFDHIDHGDETHNLAATFDDYYPPGDAVAISGDGITWYRLMTGTSIADGTNTIDLDAEAAAVGLEYGKNFQIGFFQYDNAPIPGDGRAFANISVSSEVPPLVLGLSPADGQEFFVNSIEVDVRISETVTGVDVTDLVLTGTAAASATIDSVTDQGGNIWRFAISGLVDGPLNLSLAPDAGDIQDLDGEDLPNTTWSYTVNTAAATTDAPAAIFSSPEDNQTIYESNQDIDVLFDMGVLPFNSSAVSLSGAAAASATVGVPYQVAGNAWRIPVSGLVDGTLTMVLAQNANDIQNLSGVDLAQTSFEFTVDTASTPPGARTTQPRPNLSASQIDATQYWFDQPSKAELVAAIRAPFSEAPTSVWVRRLWVPATVAELQSTIDRKHVGINPDGSPAAGAYPVTLEANARSISDDALVALYTEDATRMANVKADFLSGQSGWGEWYGYNTSLRFLMAAVFALDWIEWSSEAEFETAFDLVKVALDATSIGPWGSSHESIYFHSDNIDRYKHVAKTLLAVVAYGRPGASGAWADGALGQLGANPTIVGDEVALISPYQVANALTHMSAGGTAATAGQGHGQPSQSGYETGFYHAAIPFLGAWDTAFGTELLSGNMQYKFLAKGFSLEYDNDVERKRIWNKYGHPGFEVAAKIHNDGLAVWLLENTATDNPWTNTGFLLQGQAFRALAGPSVPAAVAPPTQRSGHSSWHWRWRDAEHHVNIVNPRIAASRYEPYSRSLGYRHNAVGLVEAHGYRGAIISLRNGIELGTHSPTPYRGQGQIFWSDYRPRFPEETVNDHNYLFGAVEPRRISPGVWEWVEDWTYRFLAEYGGRGGVTLARTKYRFTESDHVLVIEDEVEADASRAAIWRYSLSHAPAVSGLQVDFSDGTDGVRILLEVLDGSTTFTSNVAIDPR